VPLSPSSSLPAVLVVDDHPVAREPLAKLLRYEGYDAICAGNGVEALESMSLSRPDLILLDVMMPKMNGLDFLAHVRADARFRDIPVIALTGSMDPKQIRRLHALGVVEVLTKARFTVEELLQHVRANTRQGKTAAAAT
jgi:chemosensory pili system protein ChpA (sensor histidine kinase/response regulator)